MSLNNRSRIKRRAANWSEDESIALLKLAQPTLVAGRTAWTSLAEEHAWSPTRTGESRKKRLNEWNLRRF